MENTNPSEVRREKLAGIRNLGINPYPHKYSPDSSILSARNDFEANSSREGYKIAGRLMAYRDHGKVAFAEVRDQSGTIQVYFETDNLNENKKNLLALLDLGDIVGFEGSVFRTRRGEVTIKVKDFDLLTKTLLPLPEKWKGIQDPELKYRRRSEYLTANPELRGTFTKRSKAISAMREFLDSNGFLEVETPLLQQVYGGATARPFKTNVNALGEDFFLSISPELYLKKMIAAGFERVYTICKNFRNEGIDRTHNPEFTMMECYQTYADYNDMMKLTEDMYAFIFQKVLGTTKVGYSGRGREVEIDFTPPWKRAKMLDLVLADSGIDASNSDVNQLREKISRLESESFFKEAVPKEHLDKWNWGELVSALFEHYSESKLIQPTFVIDHPKESTPLCKIHRQDQRLIERFEPFVFGCEIGNAYSELNDPIRQRELLEEQIRTRKNDEIPGEIDEDFCRAIDFGIPPTGGLGLGVDRLAMFLTNSPTIKDVIFFPLMKRGDRT